MIYLSCRHVVDYSTSCTSAQLFIVSDYSLLLRMLVCSSLRELSTLGGPMIDYSIHTLQCELVLMRAFNYKWIVWVKWGVTRVVKNPQHMQVLQVSGTSQNEKLAVLRRVNCFCWIVTHLAKFLPQTWMRC